MEEMGSFSVDTPVALFVFNRPDRTRQVMEEIAAVKPRTLLVVADGPREGHPDDETKCQDTRAVIDDNVSWNCTIRRNYADHNLGLFERFVTGLRWLFQDVSEAIILEDDCVPNRDFFRFCETMLEMYRDDERVMDISGSNLLGGWKADRQDYHFSYYGGIWGWATWRRAWELYDPEMSLWTEPEVRQRVRDVIADRRQYRSLEMLYKEAYQKQETWDYPWVFARQINSALSVVPAENLVTNIGFGEEATNTTNKDAKLAKIPQGSLEFPIERNQFVAVDREFDRRYHRMRPISHRNRLLRACRTLLH